MEFSTGYLRVGHYVQPKTCTVGEECTVEFDPNAMGRIRTETELYRRAQWDRVESNSAA